MNCLPDSDLSRWNSPERTMLFQRLSDLKNLRRRKVLENVRAVGSFQPQPKPFTLHGIFAGCGNSGRLPHKGTGENQDALLSGIGTDAAQEGVDNPAFWTISRIRPRRAVARNDVRRNFQANSGRRRRSWSLSRATMLECIWLTRLSESPSVCPISFIVNSS